MPNYEFYLEYFVIPIKTIPSGGMSLSLLLLQADIMNWQLHEQ